MNLTLAVLQYDGMMEKENGFGINILGNFEEEEPAWR
jgi:hypothetical protein